MCTSFCGHVNFNFFAEKFVRHRVPVILIKHMVVEADGGDFDVAELKAHGVERQQGWTLQRFERFCAAAGAIRKRLVIELLKQAAHLLVQLRKTLETVVSKRCQNPPLNFLHRFFHDGLIFGFSGPGCYDTNAIVIGPPLIGAVEIRIVATGAVDRTFSNCRA